MCVCHVLIKSYLLTYLIRASLTRAHTCLSPSSIIWYWPLDLVNNAAVHGLPQYKLATTHRIIPCRAARILSTAHAGALSESNGRPLPTALWPVGARLAALGLRLAASRVWAGTAQLAYRMTGWDQPLRRPPLMLVDFERDSRVRI